MKKDEIDVLNIWPAESEWPYDVDTQSTRIQMASP
jgi:hypothetical protein